MELKTKLNSSISTILCLHKFNTRVVRLWLYQLKQHKKNQWLTRFFGCVKLPSINFEKLKVVQGCSWTVRGVTEDESKFRGIAPRDIWCETPPYASHRGDRTCGPYKCGNIEGPPPHCPLRLSAIGCEGRRKLLVPCSLESPLWAWRSSSSYKASKCTWNCLESFILWYFCKGI